MDAVDTISEALIQTTQRVADWAAKGAEDGGSVLDARDVKSA